MTEVPHGKDYHPEGNVWEHTLATFKHRKHPDLTLSLSLLLHDSGKPGSENTGDKRFDGHAELGARIAARFLRRLGFRERTVEPVEFLVRYHMMPAALKILPPFRTEKIFASPLFPTLLELYRADLSSSYGDEDGYYEACRIYRAWQRDKGNPYLAEKLRKRGTRCQALRRQGLTAEGLAAERCAAAARGSSAEGIQQISRQLGECSNRLQTDRRGRVRQAASLSGRSGFFPVALRTVSANLPGWAVERTTICSLRFGRVRVEVRTSRPLCQRPCAGQARTPWDAEDLAHHAKRLFVAYRDAVDVGGHVAPVSAKDLLQPFEVAGVPHIHGVGQGLRRRSRAGSVPS